MRIPITAVDVRPVHPQPGGRVLAYVSIEIGGWIVIHDMRIIRGDRGFIVAFPSRKRTDHCPRCGVRNPYRSAWCGACGQSLDPDRPAPWDEDGRTKLYADIIHPIDRSVRLDVELAVMRAYREALDPHRESDGESVRSAGRIA